MQPQHRIVRIKNDEYEREQQRLAKQITEHVVILRNDHIFAFRAVWKHAHILKLFQRPFWLEEVLCCALCILAKVTDGIV